MMSSSSPAAVAVEKATSDLLNGPDWTMNINICDSINSRHWQAKDVMKALRKRLQHKSSKVQLLALTLLETMVKNCGEYVHLQIGDRNILGEMIKIVRKEADMLVRNKILILLDSWQQAFGGRNGKHTHYYWAYEELRRSGVQFHKRSSDASSIFTPLDAHPTLRDAYAGFGLPSNSSKMLDETMAPEMETLSLSGLDSMRNVMELLTDMLQAVNPNDQAAIKYEMIVDLVNRCHSNQKKLLKMLTTTGDEELLAQGLELNDSLQTVLDRHDAIASGSVLPIHRNSSSKPAEASTSKSSEMSSFGKAEVSISSKPTDVKNPSPMLDVSSQAPVASVRKAQVNKEEVEDDLAQLAGRHSKARTTPATESPSAGSSEDSNDTGITFALSLTNPPEAVKTSKEQDMIDLLTLALVTTKSSPQASSTHNYPGNQVQVSYDSYVVPWAQPQPQPQNHQEAQSEFHVQYQPIPQPQYQFQYQPQSQLQIQPQSQLQPQFQTQLPTNCHPQFESQAQFRAQPGPQSQVQSQFHLQPDCKSQPQFQAQSQLQYQAQTPLPNYQSFSHPQYHPMLQPQIQPQAQGNQLMLQPSYSHYSSAHPPPPWAATPGYYNGQSHISAGNAMISTTQTSFSASNLLVQAAGPLQQFNSFSSAGTNGSFIMGDSQVNPGLRNATPPAVQKPFIPAYRLFEDLNVLGRADGRLEMTSSSSLSLSSVSSQGLVGGSATQQGLGKY